MNDIQEKANNVMVLKTKGRKKDKIREYFVKKDGRKVCTFKDCKITYADITSVTVLKSHLQNCHKLKINEEDNNETEVIKEYSKVHNIMEADEHNIYNVYS